MDKSEVLLFYTGVMYTVLQALAVVDTLVLISTLLIQSFRRIGWTAYDNVYRYIFIVFYPMIYSVRLVDNWLIVLLTVNRYIAVCQPLKIHTRCGTARTWSIIIIMAVASVLFSLPRCFEYKLVDNGVHEFVPTSLAHDRVYMIFYRTSLFFVVMYLAPMSLMMILNGMLVVALRRSQRHRVTTLRCHVASPTSSLTRRRSPSRSTQNGSATSPLSPLRLDLILAYKLVFRLTDLNLSNFFNYVLTIDIVNININYSYQAADPTPDITFLLIVQEEYRTWYKTWYSTLMKNGIHLFLART